MTKRVVKLKNAFFCFILEMAHKEKEKEIDFEKETFISFENEKCF